MRPHRPPAPAAPPARCIFRALRSRARPRRAAPRHALRACTARFAVRGPAGIPSAQKVLFGLRGRASRRPPAPRAPIVIQRNT
jgi:hypothetical protein